METIASLVGGGVRGAVVSKALVSRQYEGVAFRELADSDHEVKYPLAMLNGNI